MVNWHQPWGHQCRILYFVNFCRKFPFNTYAEIFLFAPWGVWGTHPSRLDAHLHTNRVVHLVSRVDFIHSMRTLKGVFLSCFITASTIPLNQIYYSLPLFFFFKFFHPVILQNLCIPSDRIQDFAAKKNVSLHFTP